MKYIFYVRYWICNAISHFWETEDTSIWVACKVELCGAPYNFLCRLPIVKMSFTLIQFRKHNTYTDNSDFSIMHSFFKLLVENTLKLIFFVVHHMHNSKLIYNDGVNAYMTLHTYLKIRRWHNTTQPKLFSHRADSVNVLQWVLELLFCWMKDRCFHHLSWTSQTGKVCSVAWFTCIACWFCFLRTPARSMISLCTLLCVVAYAFRHDLYPSTEALTGWKWERLWQICIFWGP
jgi:hypothetical protein